MAFVKGQSGNPNGRPRKGETITETLRQQAFLVDQTLPDGTKVERRVALANMIWGEALKGDPAFCKMIGDRVDGLPRQTVDLGGQDENPLEVAIKFIDPASDNGGD
jgi:hypothetical protein